MKKMKVGMKFLLKCGQMMLQLCLVVSVLQHAYYINTNINNN